MQSLDGYFVPIADIIETHDSILIEVELPGLVKNDETIGMELTNGLLEIKGEIKGELTENQLANKEMRYVVKERIRGRFKKQIPLNHEVSEHDIRAKLQNGILYIEIKKLKSKNPNLTQKINIL